MADHQIVIAGFGGQRLLFSGKVLAYAGLIEGRELSWLPSYGPEMRGGTANCNVILSDAPIGSPIVNTPNVLMVMNNPSLDKYENAVQPGGKIFLDSTLIARKVTRTDVEAYYVPATKMAMDMGMPTLANMILLGALIAKTGCVREESLADALHKVIPARKADLFDLNMQALQAGKEFAGRRPPASRWTCSSRSRRRTSRKRSGSSATRWRADRTWLSCRKHGTPGFSRKSVFPSWPSGTARG